MLNIKKVSSEIQDFHSQNTVENNFVLPQNLIPYKVFLIALLTFVRLFVNYKTKIIIDKILNALKIID